MEFESRGARALVHLHEAEMRSLLSIWRKAKAADVRLPKTDDPDYASLEHLLHHLLRAGRGYLTWVCEVLGRPDPGMPPAPAPEVVDAEADRFLEGLFDAWRTHLSWMPDAILDAHTTYPSRWKEPFTIGEMLEHAVVHPMRHRFQLEELLGK